MRKLGTRGVAAFAALRFGSRGAGRAFVVGHMTTHRLLLLIAVTPLVGCASTNEIVVELSPDVISSLDGTVHVRATAFSGQDVHGGDSITFTVAYTDRNGVDHPVDSIKATAKDSGVAEATFTGLTWDGTGTVTAEVKKDGKTIDGTATFAVLDRSPPVVTIMPPAMIRINMQVAIPVHITDEIGISSASCDTSGNGGGGNNGCRGGGRTTFSAGQHDVTLMFDYQANDTQVGQMITFYAIASDLSGNLGVATPVVATIIP
jgi:hypothetical protein